MYKWGSNKLYRFSIFGNKFDPESISNNDRIEHLSLIEKAKETLRHAIKSLKKPLNNAREAHNEYYGIASRKSEFEKVTAHCRAIKKCIKECKEALVMINELEKNYNSLSNEYCSDNFARRVFKAIDDLPYLRKAVEKCILPFVEQEQEEQPLSRAKMKRG